MFWLSHGVDRVRDRRLPVRILYWSSIVVLLRKTLEYLFFARSKYQPDIAQPKQSDESVAINSKRVHSVRLPLTEDLIHTHGCITLLFKQQSIFNVGQVSASKKKAYRFLRIILYLIQFECDTLS